MFVSLRVHHRRGSFDFHRVHNRGGFTLGSSFSSPTTGLSIFRSSPLVSVQRRHSSVAVKPPLGPATRFTVNGAISPMDNFFTVDPALSDDLVSKIMAGEFVGIRGHRASGKTTAVLWARQHQLKNSDGSRMPSIYIDVSGCAPHDSTRFWKELGQNVTQHIDGFEKIPGFPKGFQIDSSTTFKQFFSQASQLGGTLILFLDEFDVLFNNPTLLDEVKTTMRVMKQDKEVFKSLRSCSIIGPFSLEKVATAGSKRNISPWNVSSFYSAPYFTIEQTRQLFEDYKVARSGSGIPSDLVDQIHSDTTGHPAMVNLCGKYIDERLRKAHSQVTLSVWTAAKLEPTFWQTVRRYASSVQIANAVKEHEAIVDGYLYNRKNRPDQGDEIEDLISKGVLSPTNPPTFSSPLIESLAIDALGQTSGYKLKLRLLPHTQKPAEFLKQALRCFDENTMQEAVDLSYKQDYTNSVPIKQGVQIPQEVNYQIQLNHVLQRSLKPGPYQIVAERKKGSKKCDVTVRDNTNGETTAIELSVGCSNRDILEHYDRASIEYANIPDVKATWVVNFLIDFPKKDRGKLVWPTQTNIEAVFVSHDRKWSNATIYTLENGKVRATNVDLKNKSGLSID